MSVIKNFKINRHLDEIFAPLREDRMVIVEAPTGSGKTLGLPIALASSNNQIRVRVTIPTVIATKSAYNFVKNNTDFSVGYAAGRTRSYSDSDQIVYFTTGHLVAKVLGLIRSKKLPLPPKIFNRSNRNLVRNIFGDILMIDETHTATVNISILLGLMKYLFTDEEGKYRGPALIMASATTNTKDLSLNFPSAVHVKVGVREYPIQTVYSSTIHDPSRVPENVLIQEITKIISSELRKNPQAVGLIFRPGKREVENTIRRLEFSFRDTNIVPAYSGLTDEEISAIVTPTGDARIIVGTNYVESSVTISDADFIISDMLEKKVRSTKSGIGSLSSELISKASSTQRVGRVGRTKPGTAYLLISEGNYNKLHPYHDREVERIPLEQTILSMSGYGLDITQILSINRKDYDEAVDNLLWREMLTRVDGDLEVTDVGTFVTDVALDISHAHMIYLALKGEYSDELKLSAIALACLLESYGNGYVYIPRRDRNLSEEENTANRDEAIERFSQLALSTDVGTLLNMFWNYSNFALDYRYVAKASHSWSQLYNINNKRWLEFIGLFSSVVDNISSTIEETSGYIGDFLKGKNREVDVLSITSDLYEIWKTVFAHNRMNRSDFRTAFFNRKYPGRWLSDRNSSFMSTRDTTDYSVFYPAYLMKFGNTQVFSIGMPGRSEDEHKEDLRQIEELDYVSDLEFEISETEGDVELIGSDDDFSSGESDMESD